MAYSYIERTYGKVFEPADRVRHTVCNWHGTVNDEDPSAGHYVQVIADGRDHERPCHPDELEIIPDEDIQGMERG